MPSDLIRAYPLDEILVLPDRTRGDFPQSQADALRTSIEQIGLLHPIRVKPTGELVSGERRLRAVRELGRVLFSGVWYEGTIPAILTAELTEDEALEEELHENIYRLDLTWQRQVSGMARLHAMRVASNASQTLEQTAAETSRDTRFVSDSVVIADHLSDPDIANARTVKEARKRVVEKAERVVLAELARRTAAMGGQEPSDKFRLTQGDCVEVLSLLPAFSFDVCLTDPPYGINADSQNKVATNAEAVSRGGTRTMHQYEDSAENFLLNLDSWASAITAVMKESAHLFWFLEIKYFPDVQDCLESLGWRVYDRPLIWAKGTWILGNAMLWPARSYESILFATRGNRPLQGAAHSDIIQIPVERDKIHAAQKPVELYRELLSWSVLPGDNVLDPFCGSGTIFPAAKQLMCRATGIDLDISLARDRMAQL